MLKPTLSICSAVYRPWNLQKLYDSIIENWEPEPYWEEPYSNRTFELILCGFIPPPNELLNKENVKFIKDFGSPCRSLARAFANAQGKYITVATDDGVFLSKSLSRAVIKMEYWKKTRGSNDKHVVVAKYVEGNYPWWCMTLEPDAFGYTLSTAYPKCPYIPDDWLIFNLFYMKKEYYDYLGGIDCRFEITTVGLADLAARAQRDNCTTELMNEPTMHFTLTLPVDSGEHGPVHFGQHFNDLPLYQNIYNDETCLQRTIIEKDSWQKSPEKWIRRHGV